MSHSGKKTTEADRSLDPADWGAFRQTAHALLDDCIDYMETLPDRRAWTPVPDAVKARLTGPAPGPGRPLDGVVADFKEMILPHATGNGHPRFFGWVHGTGNPAGMLAELCAATMNSNCGGRDHGAVYVERQVIEWARGIFGFPEGASGILTGGTSSATLLALSAARVGKVGAGLRKAGMEQGPQLVAYASAEAHSANTKALEIMGVGANWLRPVPVDANHALVPERLRAMVQEDLAAGRQPFCAIATVGTVNTAGGDDVNAVADICAEFDLWLHVDGAFGAWARLADDPWRAYTNGIERADSLAFDFHKWMYVQYDVGCVLFRDEAVHRAAFAARPDYLAATTRGVSGGEPWYCDYGLDLSRGFRALKVWFTINHYGTDELGRKVSDNCRQAARLADLVTGDPDLELMTPAGLNICCFRYVGQGGLDDAALDALNAAIVLQVQEEGFAVPSSTRIGGRYAIRVAITNHRTRLSDMDLFRDRVVQVGRELEGRS
ncbi:MAG: hypothetical protein KDE22_08645 [Rhodobacterales bacterium]|nr:hypothetical protein [Rhodobacterales bacterium]